MTIKKMLALVLALALCLSIAACGSTAETPAPVATNPPAEKAETPAAPEAPEAPVEEGLSMPEKFDKSNINWIVPAAAGSAIDLPTRSLVDAVGDALGANIVVENLAGASQTIGASEFSIREANGHNVLTMANACYFTQPLVNELTYDIAQWRPIVKLANPSYCVVAVKAGSELADADKLIEKLQSGNYTYGYSNAVSIGHLAALQMLDTFDAAEGTPMIYTGSPELTAAVLSGEIDFAVMEDSVLLSYVQSGEMEAVIAGTNEAHRLFPDAAYIGEYTENFVPICGVKCVAVLKDTPEEEVEWLKAKLNEAIASDAYQEFLVSAGYDKMEPMSEEDLSAWLTASLEVTKEVMQNAGLIG